MIATIEVENDFFFSNRKDVSFIEKQMDYVDYVGNLLKKENIRKFYLRKGVILFDLELIPDKEYLSIFQLFKVLHEEVDELQKALNKNNGFLSYRIQVKYLNGKVVYNYKKSNLLVKLVKRCLLFFSH